MGDATLYPKAGKRWQSHEGSPRPITTSEKSSHPSIFIDWMAPECRCPWTSRPSQAGIYLPRESQTSDERSDNQFVKPVRTSAMRSTARVAARGKRRRSCTAATQGRVNSSQAMSAPADSSERPSRVAKGNALEGDDGNYTASRAVVGTMEGGGKERGHEEQQQRIGCKPARSSAAALIPLHRLVQHECPPWTARNQGGREQIREARAVPERAGTRRAAHVPAARAKGDNVLADASKDPNSTRERGVEQGGGRSDNGARATRGHSATEEDPGPRPQATGY